LIRVLETFWALGIEFVSLSERVDSTPKGLCCERACAKTIPLGTPDMINSQTGEFVQ